MLQKYKQDPTVIVDLRSEFAAVRDQGERPLCLVFAVSDLNAFNHSLIDALSVEHLAYCAYEISGCSDYDQGLTCDAVFKALSIHGQPYEHIHPYSTSSLIPTKCENNNVQFFKAKGFQRPAVVTDLKSFIDKGMPVAVGVSLTSDFFSPEPPYIIDDQYDSVGMHAMVVVGYGKADGKDVFLVRNSWGDNWASLGHVWLTSTFCSNRVQILIGLEK